MVGNAMFFDERDEICGRVARQRGFGKVFVRGNKIFRLAKNVAEIAAAAAGDQDFLADALGMLEDSDAPPAFAGFDRAEESRGAGAKNESVKFVVQE